MRAPADIGGEISVRRRQLIAARHVLRREHDGLSGTQHTRSGQLPTRMRGPCRSTSTATAMSAAAAASRTAAIQLAAQFRRPVRRVHTNDVRAGADQPGDALGRPPWRDRAWRRS